MRILTGLGVAITTAVACFAGDKEIIQTAVFRAKGALFLSAQLHLDL